MDEQERQQRIIEYLKVKATSYGQVYTFQMAIPPELDQNIPPERFEILKASLIQQNTNLIPVIVRRTEAYDEDIDYEVVHGADWVIVAKELEVEKLWVWVFSLSNEEAQDYRQAMQKLLGDVEPAPEIVTQFESLLNRYIGKALKEEIHDYVTAAMHDFLEAEWSVQQQSIEDKFNQLFVRYVQKTDPLDFFNHSPQEELETKLKNYGISQSKKIAGNIIEARQNKEGNVFNGFSDVINSVRGLGDKTLFKILEGWRQTAGPF